MNQDNYNDIIDLPHYEPTKHKRMTKVARAAQFSPFAALSGYDEAIQETGRITEDKIEVSEDSKIDIDRKLQIINEKIKQQPEILVTYFEADHQKSGGKYITYQNKVKRIDAVEQNIVFTDKTKMKITNVLNIQIISKT